MRLSVAHLNRRQGLAYAAAVLLIALTVVARWGLNQFMGERALCLSFLPAVVLSAWLGGLGPGLLATALGIVGVDLMGLHWSTGFREISAAEIVQLSLFVALCLFLSVAAEKQRRDIRSREAAMAVRRRAEDRLTAEHAITRILADGTSLEEAAPTILQSLRDSLHARVGLLWLPDPARRVLECAFVSSDDDPVLREFAARCRGFTFSAGVGLPGRVWESREPAWIVDVINDRNFPRARIAADAGIRSGVAFPIHSRGEFFAVMEFFTSVPLEADPALLSMMRAVGSEIGQFILRRRAEEALRESEQSLRLALEAGRMGTWQWEIESGRVRWSAALEQLHGLSPGTFAGTFDAFLSDVHPEDRQRVAEQIQRTVAQKKDHHIEYRMVRPDGAVRWVEGRGKLVLDPSGNAIGMVGVCLDITDRKRSEQERSDLLAREQQARADAERASRAKDEFLAVLSHELRTPLTPVLLTVTLLENSPQLTADQRRDLQTIRRNVELEARLIDDLLDLTRIARGKLQLALQTADAHLLIRSALEICHRTDGVQVEVDLRAACHHVRADPARFQQVCWNLLNNAHKFTPPGGKITVRTFNRSDDCFRLEVADTGIGIDPGALPRIFDAFEQGNGEPRRFGGLGLGLAISRALVQAQGGHIEAHSEGHRRGATFAVELPTVRAPSPIPPDKGRDSPRAQTPHQPLRILVVEDHEPTRRVMTKLLADLGHRPMSASGVESAMKVIGEQPVDLVISDLGLPDGNGHDLMRQIRERFDVRGIALSGYGMEEDLRRSEEAGFAEHLIKPIDVNRLQAAIRRVTDQPAVA